MTTTTAPTDTTQSDGSSTPTVESPAPAAPIPNDGGKPPYKDPTGDQAAANVDRERRDADDDGKAGKEAAKYRRQLRDVESERDSLRSQLAAFQTQAVDQLAEDAGIVPAALWAAGTELPTLLHDDGRVNHDAVSAAIVSASAALGLKRTASAAEAGITGGTAAASSRNEATWSGITKAS